MRPVSTLPLELASPAPPPYRIPAEWAPHSAPWLAWPHYHGDWPGKFEPIPWVYTEIIRNLARHERVELIVNNAAAERQARKRLERSNAPLNNVHFHRWPTNRSWLRDSGCIFTKAHVGTAALGCPPGEARLSPARADREGHDVSPEPALSKRSAPQGAAHD